jgi:aromatic ring-opening dioxygenase catalytic subunit (LigB family)
MATLVGVLHTSHGGFTTIPSDRWAARRDQRSYRPEVPVESQEEMDQKWARTEYAKGVLREKLAELRPDVIVVFGDDQAECFDFNNFPGLAIYLGTEMTGRGHSAPGHPALATAILTGLLGSGFDPAFMMEMPKPQPGMSHAVMTPLAFFTDGDIPTVPVLINAYFAPQVTGERCRAIGQAVRRIIDDYPEDLRVVAIGSGGLWHTPAQKNSWLNEEFDRASLGYLEKGDVESWVRHFDNYLAPSDDTSQDWATVRRGVTGLPTPGGPQGGSRETLCWIAAAATAEGRPAVVVDYIPIYASPVGSAFAYCDDL